LSRYQDIDVEIFEAAEKLAEVGAGIGLFPRNCFGDILRLFCLSIIFIIGHWEVIQQLDLEEELLKYTELRQTEDPGNSKRT
jgi:salicylate hydroxylase